MAIAEEWVIWNGSMGVVDTVRLGIVEDGAGRQAYLAAPYDVVGPFSLDELEGEGRIAFGECLVMSVERWQRDQVALRVEAREKRRAWYARFEDDDEDDDHEEARGVLGLRQDGKLSLTEINAAFRRLAKTAHPDAGGSSDAYRRISEARDLLLGLFGDAA